MKFYGSKTTIHSFLFFVITYAVCISNTMYAQNRHADVITDKIPPRIIRACCAFGYDLKLWGIPFVNIDQVISVDDLGEHYFMGNSKEGVGTVYTRKGGFIDIGHVRDQMDWTRFLFVTITKNKGKGEVHIPLRREAGKKNLYLNIPTTLSHDDCMLLAGKIAFDFSLWHEISTWYGASTVPFISEKFSSFSLEDVYSNLLGVHIGIRALKSKLPYNEAATQLLGTTLDSLDVVQTAQETYDAYDAIHNIWFTSKKRIPSRHITLKRDPNVLLSSHPWLVPNLENDTQDGIILEVPLLNSNEVSLTNFYQFTIDVNRKIPIAEILDAPNRGIITQNDFALLLEKISQEIKTIEDDERSKK